MPRINKPEDVAVLLPNLPHRLRELRMEWGWTLDDIARITGVTQKGVASNWEATNQRRRTPPLTTLLVLQRWYGVSLDYLIGQPGAEYDSPAVKAGKAALRERLMALGSLYLVDPSERARLALRAAMEVAPEVFFLERIAAWIFWSVEDVLGLLKGGLCPDDALSRLAELFGIESAWFYALNPTLVPNATS